MAKKYSVDEYLAMLRLSKRSEKTIHNYWKVIKTYADFIGVPVEKVHNNLSVSNLLKYAASRKHKSDAGTKTNLSILHRYFEINGVQFDTLEFNAMKPRVNPEHNDKPLELEALQKMMDLTDTRGHAFLAFLISSGCRADEACNVLLSDVHGDCVHIRNEIAKNGHGGKVYLTSEAKEYMDIWLKERDQHLKLVDQRSVGLKKIGAVRPVNDQRLFGMSYSAANKFFARLYDKVDGIRGKYHRECTIHSCRKFFRTHAATTMHPDLVTGLMRQTGYLDSTYVRMNDAERYQQFKVGEAALYITRADHRVQSGKLSQLERENAELKERLSQVEQGQTEQAQRERADLTKLIREEIMRQKISG